MTGAEQDAEDPGLRERVEEDPGTRERDAQDLGERERDADARALASTLRLRILRLCLDEALTNRELADRLGRNPATTLHHVRTLVDRGYLAAEPVRRGARGSREVPYRATGRSWHSRKPNAFSRVLIDTFLEEVALADPDTVGTTRLGVRLDAAGKAELDRRVQELFDELAARPSDPDGTPYSIFYAVHEDTGRLRRDRPTG
ncbi:winged helix-turn-helix domain-containing protein [Cellulomonas cellasea]|uniref:ArsR family transcriptional regulator n=2 Tax=Cellulomonas cellasea TaxID=43670 RepID=A0A0A0B8R8_9CELL|nr:winged helix-turn-helix domain-containing protein [Cellulomonas cellasea]KGM02209.1 ArsR family transcriptional regulator [Cellulomonas cellasea DSM 20118]GEA86164.1 ArsR family transcriptional regulator [Cellulomonas cellasea]